MSFVLIGMVCFHTATAPTPVCDVPTLWDKAFTSEEQCLSRKKELDEVILPIKDEDGHFECQKEDEIQ